MSNSNLLFYFLCFYCTGSVFEIIVMLENEAVANQKLYKCYRIVNQNLMFHCHMSVDTHCFTSLYTSSAYSDDNLNQKLDI